MKDKKEHENDENDHGDCDESGSDEVRNSSINGGSGEKVKRMPISKQKGYKCTKIINSQTGRQN